MHANVHAKWSWRIWCCNWNSMLGSLFQFSVISTVDVARAKTEYGTLLRCRNSTAGNNLPWKKPPFPSSFFFYISFSSWSLKTGAVIHDWTLNIYDGWCLCLETTLCTSACKALPLRNQMEIRSYNTLADYRFKYYSCLNYSLEFNYSVHFHICNYSEMKLDLCKYVLYIEVFNKSSQKRMPHGYKHASVSRATSPAQVSQMWQLLWKHLEEDASGSRGSAY